MIYLIITACIFVSDLMLKAYIDKKYPCGLKHPRLNGAIILEKYYNRGAALNLLSKKPNFLKLLQTLLLITVGIFYYLTLRVSKKPIAKAGCALLFGGGCSNLLDRYAKGHVVDYFRINRGPKWLKRIIFNLSDFSIFIGAILTVCAADRKATEESQ